MLEILTATVISLIKTTGYFGIFFLMAVGSAFIPIPSQITLPFAGYLVNKGILVYPLVVLAAALGDLAGSFISYSIGYLVEETVVMNLIKKHGRYVLLTESDYTRAVKWFNKYGDKFVFISKLVPGLRYLSALPPGVLKMNKKKFALYTFLGSLIWCSLLVYVGVYFGRNWDMISPIIEKSGTFVVLLILIVALLYVNVKLRYMRRKT